MVSKTPKRTHHTTRRRSRRHGDYEYELIRKMLSLTTMLRLYHWDTMSYATHKATGELYEKLDGKLDMLVELFVGKKDKVFDRRRFRTLHIENVTSNGKLRTHIQHFIKMLERMDSHVDKTSDTDLLNLRDEIIADSNQFLYLLRLK